MPKIVPKSLFKRFVIKTKHAISVSVTFVIVMLISLTYDVKVKLYDKDLDSQDCFHIPYSDLMSSDNLRLVGSKNMFFIETTCKGMLNSREACIVEAASRTNPNWTVVVMFTGPLNRHLKKHNTYQTLTEIDNKNIVFTKINIDTYTNNTPIKNFFKNNNVNRSPYRVAHAVEALKLLTLYKFGGVYLDFDMMATASFNSLPPTFVAKESVTNLSTSIMAFTAGMELLYLTLGYYVDVYDPHHKTIGPDMLTKIFNVLCNTNKVTDMSAHKCSGISILDLTYFFPLKKEKAYKLFHEHKLMVKPGFAMHMWNKNTLKHNQTIPKNSAYGRLAEAHCPTIFNLYGDEFGL